MEQGQRRHPDTAGRTEPIAPTLTANAVYPQTGHSPLCPARVGESLARATTSPFSVPARRQTIANSKLIGQLTG